MGKAIIRQGDKTSHGGTVKEGFPHTSLYGKPIAGLGHLVSCPLCKGDFPIIEGASNHFFSEVGTAVEGMRTACGAVLIASQHTATLDDGSGNATSGSSATSIAPTTSAPPPGAEKISRPMYDLYFEVKDLEGRPLAGHDYVIELESGAQLEGVTDHQGLTRKIDALSAEAVTLTVFSPESDLPNPDWDR